jgi:protocatechuate 3,4-dioxygenase beta subunit
MTKKENRMRLGHLLPFLLLVRFVGAQSVPPTPAIVEGTVIDAGTGAPIAGARVKLDFGRDSPDEPLFTRTGPEGRFEFSVPPHAGYTIFAQARGYFVEQRASADGALRASVRLPLTAYAAISGQVTDPYGVPLPEAEVDVLQKRAAGSSGASSPLVQTVAGGQFELVHKAQIRADDLGRFRAARLEPGSYYVVATTPQRLGALADWEPTYRPTYYPGAADPLSAKPLELAAGARAQADIRILRLTGVRIAGHLTKPPSSEQVYTQVTIVPQEKHVLNGVRRAAAAKADEWEILNVLPGKYTLLALTTAVGDNRYSVRPVFGALENIEVRDREMTGIEVALSPLPDLAGTVTFAQGCKPVPLRIRPQPSVFLSMLPGEAIPAADGTFALNRLTPGRYTLYVESLTSFQRPETSVRLGDREIPKEGFEVPLAGPGTLRVTVSCEGAGRAQ